jgi:Holliday junction resolvase
VVHYTRTWNPAKEDQASDRAWRIGQTKDVYVYYPVVSAEDFTTFDVKLDHLLERKRSLAGVMLNGSPDISPADFRLEEVVPDADVDSIDERVTIDIALRMEWRHFEGLAAALWSKKGFDTVYCTPASADNGVDVVAIQGLVGELVQTKSSASETRPLNWDAVKEVVTGEAFYRRRHSGVLFKKVWLTNQSFNQQAHENARLNDVTLLERSNLEEMLNQYPVTMLDIERLLYTDWAVDEC